MNWERTMLGPHIDLLSGYAFKSENYSSDESDVKLLRGDNIIQGSLRWDGVKRWSKDQIGEFEKFQLTAGDIVLAMDRTWVKAGLKCSLVEGSDLPCLLVQRVARLRGTEHLDSRFLYHSLQTHRFTEYVKGVQTETAVPHISSKQIREYPLQLPPLPEQQKIAAILSTWDRAIELTEKLIAAKQKRKQALMQQLLTGKVRLAGHGGESWKEVKLGELLTVRNEQIPNDGTHPLYSLTIEDGVTPKSERYDREFLVRDKSSKKYKVVYPGDIVFNPSNLRWGAIGIHNSSEPVLVSPIYEVLYVTDKDATNEAFLFQQLSSSRQIRLFAGMAEGTLVERTAVKLPTFLVCKILVPPKVKEQSDVSRILATADREIALISDRKSMLVKQKKGLMQQLLTGKVRVNMNAETAKG